MSKESDIVLKEIYNAYSISNGDNAWAVADIFYLITTGKYPRKTPFIKFGANTALNNVRQDVWNVGGNYVFPTTGQGMEVISTSVNDTSIGTGVRTVLIYYLDSNYVQHKIQVNLNGTKPVLTSVADIFRVNYMYAEEVGSTGFAVGDVDIRHISGTPVYSRISAGYNTSSQAIYTVPAERDVYLTNWRISGALGTGKFIRAFLVANQSLSDFPPIVEKPDNIGTFIQQDAASIGGTALDVPYTIPLRFSETVDIKVSAVGSTVAANSDIFSSFRGFISEAD